MALSLASLVHRESKVTNGARNCTFAAQKCDPDDTIRVKECAFRASVDPDSAELARFYFYFDEPLDAGMKVA